MASMTGSGVRRVPVLAWSPTCGFEMASEYFQRAARYLDLAKEDGQKLDPEEALGVAAIDLTRRLELSPECVTRVRMALRKAAAALDDELGY